MHTIPVFHIPDFAPLAKVIAMPTHHRPRKHARATVGAADIIPLPLTRGASYTAGKEVVTTRCKHLHLTDWQTAECIGRVASEIRRGRSTAVAVAAGIALAKLHARDNDRHGAGDCA